MDEKQMDIRLSKFLGFSEEQLKLLTKEEKVDALILFLGYTQYSPEQIIDYFRKARK
jgi:hypothetical protein